VAAWPAIALVGSYELLRMVIRSSQAAFDGTSDSRTTVDTLQEQAAQVFVEQLAADRVPPFVRSALDSASASPEHSGCETISPQVKSREEREPPSSRRRRPDAAFHEGGRRIS
jgi:hypothetical protein